MDQGLRALSGDRVRGNTVFGKAPASGGGGTTELLLVTLTGADFNSTADQAITLPAQLWRITRITVTNASTNMTTAAGGFYTAASKGGTAIVAAAQVYTALINASVVLTCTIAVPANVVTPIYLSLTTGQGAAATADVRVYGVLIG
jgi:hypothetical protein